MLKKNLTTSVDVVIYVIVFLVSQVLGIGFFATFINKVLDTSDPAVAVWAVILGNGASAMLLFSLFVLFRWTPMNLNFIKSGQWNTLFWTIVASASSFLMSAFFMSLLPEKWQKFETENIFEQLFSSPFGYITIALVAPLIEEMVFRGAVLRRILYPIRKNSFFQPDSSDNSLADDDGNLTKLVHPSKLRVCAGLFISSLLFALVHGNLAQGPHAFVVGLFLGWLYYRTNSILPAVLFHWINNTIPFILLKIYPEIPFDADAIMFFDNNTLYYGIAIVMSVLLFAFSFVRLDKIMKKA